MGQAGDRASGSNDLRSCPVGLPGGEKESSREKFQVSPEFLRAAE